MKIERRKPLTANVGILSVGLDTYWEQFPGLLDEMTRKSIITERIPALLGFVLRHMATAEAFPPRRTDRCVRCPYASCCR